MVRYHQTSVRLADIRHERHLPCGPSRRQMAVVRSTSKLRPATRTDSLSVAPTRSGRSTDQTTPIARRPLQSPIPWLTRQSTHQVSSPGASGGDFVDALTCVVRCLPKATKRTEG